MNNEIVIKEKYSKYWPAAAVVSLMLAAVFFVSYHLIEDVLLTGYLRLASFACFAIALISFFKVYDGQVEISVSADDEFIDAVYKVRGTIISESKNPRSDFYKIKVDQLPNKSLYNDFMKSDKCVRFRRKDESEWYYFNEIESRVIPLTEENARRLRDFLENYSTT